MYFLYCFRVRQLTIEEATVTVFLHDLYASVPGELAKPVAGVNDRIFQDLRIPQYKDGVCNTNYDCCISYFRELNKLLTGNEKLNQPSKRYFWMERKGKTESDEAKRRSKPFKLKKCKVC